MSSSIFLIVLTGIFSIQTPHYLFFIVFISRPFEIVPSPTTCLFSSIRLIVEVIYTLTKERRFYRLIDCTSFLSKNNINIAKREDRINPGIFKVVNKFPPPNQLNCCMVNVFGSLYWIGIPLHLLEL